MKLVLMNGWFCPYAQRAWIALNYSGLKFESEEGLKIQEDETYWKNPKLLKNNPKGLIPTIIDEVNNIVVTDSLKCVEFVNKILVDFNATHRLLPEGSKEKEECKEWSEWVNQKLCSPFYIILVRTDEEEKRKIFKELVESLKVFNEKLKGPFFFGENLSMVDIALFPWSYRYVFMKDFKGDEYDVEKIIKEHKLDKYAAWFDRMKNEESVKGTLADLEALKGSYRRYADGSAKSQVGDAVRAGGTADEV